MGFEDKYIDQLIEERKVARNEKNWILSDEIRNYLDSKLVFVFDTHIGQDVYYLVEEFFRHKHKIGNNTSNRQYVEYRIKTDINANARFDAWLYSIKKNHND